MNSLAIWMQICVAHGREGQLIELRHEEQRLRHEQGKEKASQVVCCLIHDMYQGGITE